jgi:hypothetical protein
LVRNKKKAAIAALHSRVLLALGFKFHKRFRSTSTAHRTAPVVHELYFHLRFLSALHTGKHHEGALPQINILVTGRTL